MRFVATAEEWENRKQKTENRMQGPAAYSESKGYFGSVSIGLSLGEACGRQP
jgi:hypothetical protein